MPRPRVPAPAAGRAPRMLQHTKRVARVIVGLVLVALGVVLALPGIPGPGLLVVLGGLTVLSGEFDWARRARDRMRDTLQRETRRHPGGCQGPAGRATR